MGILSFLFALLTTSSISWLKLRSLSNLIPDSGIKLDWCHVILPYYFSIVDSYSLSQFCSFVLVFEYDCLDYSFVNFHSQFLVPFHQGSCVSCIICVQSQFGFFLFRYVTYENSSFNFTRL